MGSKDSQTIQREKNKISKYMKPIKILCALVVTALALVGCKKETAYESVENDAMHTRIYTLDNGLKIYLSENHETPRVTAHIAVNTGHRNDPADCTGLAHYLEHLMFKGTKQFGTMDYEAEKPYLDKITELYEEYRVLTDEGQRKAKYHEIDSVSQLAAKYFIPNEYDKLMATIGGAGSNAYTWFDITCYTEDIPANEIDRWAEIQADRFQNMVARGFHTELEAVYEEKNISLSNDGDKQLDALMFKLHPTHSYGTQTTIGTQEHLKNPSIKAIYEYYNRYYRPNNVAICMAGDFDSEKVIEVLKKHFSDWQKGEDVSPRQFEKQPDFTAPQDTTVLGLEQESILVGWRFDGAASMQTDTLELMRSILSNGSCGLIDLNVNQKLSVLDASAGLLQLKDYTTFLLAGNPKEGQTLDDVKNVLFAEIDKLKKGDFDDDLLVSIVNNEKRNYQSQMSSNDNRVQIMVDAFINGQDWADQVHKIERKGKITKADVISFAKRHLNDGYVVVYKKQGEDESIRKVEKPAITPISSNRDAQSAFLSEILSRDVAPIEPHFVNYDTDITKGQIGQLPLLYVKNELNDLFTLEFRYEFGDRADVRYATVGDYTDLLGTSTMTNEQIKKEFYKMACDYSYVCNNDHLVLRLYGLSENMSAAIELMEKIVRDAQPDESVYQSMVANELKSRAEAKKDQRGCFMHLAQYAYHGAENDYTNILSASELQSTNPKVFTDLLKGLLNMKHSVLYYGPMSVDELSAVVTEHHHVAAKLQDVPKNKEWKELVTAENEVLIAPYSANNIYLRSLTDEGKVFDESIYPVVTLFNEYFGGGMNSVVFQELRETRGLAYNAFATYDLPLRRNEHQTYLEHIITQNDKMMDCINTFRQITSDLPANEEAFRSAKGNLEKNLASQRVTGFAIINSYLEDQRQGLTQPAAKIVYEALPKLTLKDIVEFEKKYVANKPRRYFILGNEKELDMESLQQIAPVKRLSLEDIFGY